MAVSKRIMICVPDTLLQEVDGIVALENRNRSEFIREAMKLYICERRRRQMVKGYGEMGHLNLALASEDIAVGNEAWHLYERRLVESGD